MFWPFAGQADKFKIDKSDPKMKSIDLFEKTKLKGSGVIEDTKFLDVTSCRPRRNRSYKVLSVPLLEHSSGVVPSMTWKNWEYWLK